MKQRASLPKIASHLFLALVLFVLIPLVFVKHPWMKATIFLAWGTYFFIDFLKLLLVGTRHSIAGAYILFYAGCLAIATSVTWIGNLVLKLIFNPFFNWLTWEFQIGNLVSGIWQYVLSVPTLIAGVVLIISGALWENNAQYHEWYQELFPGSRKKMFRREF